MSIDTLGPAGSKTNTDLQETARAIEKAVTLSRANNHRFLTYLLEMARLETANLSGGGKASSRPHPLSDEPPKVVK